jgi:hypothetical protein
MIKRLRGLDRNLGRNSGPVFGHKLGLALSLALSVGLVAASLLAGAAVAQSPIPPAPVGGQPGSAPPPPAAEQGPPSNPVCVRLEGQLAMIDRGGADPARADQVRRYEEAAGKQQADLDRLQVQAKRRGCESGFFSLFTGQAPECQPLNAQIQQLRDTLDRTMSDLERIKSGNNYGQEGQRRQLIGELAQNNCGQQYRAAAAEGPSGFLDTLFGGAAHIINPGGDGAPAGTFRTVCVRSCDGYYFPISYSTVQSRFADDQRTCQRECPATDAQLYTYRNPGEDINQAVSLAGQSYTALPAAFAYRKEFNAACSCRKPGQSWADALKGADDASTLESGDIVVTDQNAKALSQPVAAPVPRGAKTGKSTAATAAAPALAAPSAQAASADASSDTTPKGTVRTVGPPFVAGH